jgi:hypothetical protein
MSSQSAFAFAGEYKPAGVHPFEAAGLGQAPFRLVGSYQQRPATACEFCGTSIVNVFQIEGADRRGFIVGCECVRKVDEGGLAGDVNLAVRERQRYNRRYGPRGKPARQAVRALFSRGN